MRKNFFKSNNMFHKLILIIMVLAFCSVAISLMAADKHTQTEKKSTKISGKCWRKVWISSEALMGKNTMPVCKTFEEVLKTTCEPPEKLKCNWTLPAGEKRFQKLQWQPLDPKEHWELIRDICLSGVLEKYRAGRWKHYEPEYKKDLAEGRLKLFTATADVDHDGKVENIVKLNRTPDCPNRVTYAVITPQAKQMDWKYRQLILYINWYSGSEIMIYDGRAYMFRWDEVPGRIMIYEGYTLPDMDSMGAINICQYQYLKGGKKK